LKNLDKYYTNVDEAETKMNNDNQEFKDKLNGYKDPLSYFFSQSSGYYQKTQDRFE